MTSLDLSTLENVTGTVMNLTDALGATRGVFGGWGQDKKIEAQKEVIINLTNAQKETAIVESNNKKELAITESNNQREIRIALIEAKRIAEIERMKSQRDILARKQNVTLSAFNLVLNLAEKDELTETMFEKILDAANNANYQVNSQNDFRL